MGNWETSSPRLKVTLSILFIGEQNIFRLVAFHDMLTFPLAGFDKEGLEGLLKISESSGNNKKLMNKAVTSKHNLMTVSDSKVANLFPGQPGNILVRLKYPCCYCK